MESENMTAKNYLDEIYRQTDGNIDTQISMYDVGTSLGLEKGEASSIAQNLIVEGLVELQTLAGGISITLDGLKSLGITPSIPAVSDDTPVLGNGPVMNEGDSMVVTTLLGEVKKHLSSFTTDYPVLEEIIIDIKTIELQMLSPNPKNGVIRELLQSLHTALSSQKDSSIAQRLQATINS